MHAVSHNKQNGKIFEELFKACAKRQGLLCIQNHLTARMVYKGRLQVVPGELDFKICSQDGRVAYLDCKSFGKSYFTFSDLSRPHQVERAVLYNDFKVPAGFVVWFRPTNQVVFFSGKLIQNSGRGARFLPVNGQLLGRFEDFDLRQIVA